VKGWEKLRISDPEMLKDNSFPRFTGGGVNKTCLDSRDGPGAVLSEAIVTVSLSAGPEPSRLSSHDQPESY